ncbi:MAG: glycosyltransferase family 2 protein [Bauldia sp.]|nr:glycosyltransferase family 2 protein [Bauldia sp.]
MAKIAVAALTCCRPRMLASLLASFAALRDPPGTEVLFLIVDNAPDAPAAALVAEWQRETRLAVAYALEPEPGIPFARNRALDEAAAHGADFLAFVDDDETVDPDWLIHLVAHQRRERSNLVGGPVRCVPPEGKLRGAERFVFNGVRDRYLRKEEKNARRRAGGDDGGVAIITNNWLGDLAWLRANDVRFDVGLRYTGGSDTALYHEAKRRGARTSWCPEAIVYEEVPRERISLAYQFARARDQAATSYLRKQAAERRSLPSSLAAIVGKFIVGTALFAAAPVTGGRTLVDGARSFGWGVGYVYALAGRKSRHYEALQGD